MNRSFTETIVLRGSRIALPCRVAAPWSAEEPPIGAPDVKWFRREARLALDNRLSIELDGSLVIDNAKVDDGDVYRCMPATKALCGGAAGRMAFSHRLYGKCMYVVRPLNSVSIEVDGDTATVSLSTASQ